MATITNAMMRAYRDQVIHLAQQAENRLRAHVTEVPLRGESMSFDRLGSTDMVLKTGIRVDTAYVDSDWSRRIAIPKTYFHTMSVESEQKLMTIHQPESEYARAQGMAMARQIDDEIIDACLADATDGDGVPVPFPVGQTVGDGTVPISFDMVTEVQEKFLEKDITTDVNKVLVVSPVQIRKLMQLTEATSADYVRREYLTNLTNFGIVPNWMGFTWILSNRLNSPAGGELDCLAFTKQGIGLANLQNPMVRIGENPDKSYLTQVFLQFSMGATRIEDNHVVRVHVLDSI